MLDLTQKRLAELCGVTPRRIRQLVAEGTITKGKDGRYTEAAVTQFIRYVRDNVQDDSAYRELIDKERYREKKRVNDIAEKLVAPVGVIEEVVGKGVKALIAVLETLPLIVKRHFPEITGDQVQLVKTAVAECRNIMADVEVNLDED